MLIFMSNLALDMGCIFIIYKNRTARRLCKTSTAAAVETRGSYPDSQILDISNFKSLLKWFHLFLFG